MKKLKKSVIPLAVIALMVSTVQAVDPSIKRDGDWPRTFKAIDLCKFPVFLDVGHFVQIRDCDKRELKLKQFDCESIGKVGTDFPCYSGCEDIEVRANFPAIFGANLTKIGSILTETSLYWNDDKNQIKGSTGGWEKLTICLDAWKAEIWRATQPDEKTLVGEITITVKPPDTGS